MRFDFTAITIIVGIVLGLLLLILLLVWLAERARRPIAHDRHPRFGCINVYRDYWEATEACELISLGKLKISGCGRAPSSGQIQSLDAIIARSEELRQRALEALAEDLKFAGLEPAQLTLTSVSLEDDIGSFGFGFTDLEQEALHPDLLVGFDFYVDFEEFDVVEAGFVH